jgi:hypothetical protein
MDLLHESGEVAGGVVLADRLVKGYERILDSARTLYGEQGINGSLTGGKTIVFNFLEGGDVGLGRPDSRLRHRYTLGGKHNAQKYGETKKNCQAHGEQHARTSGRDFQAERNDLKSMIEVRSIVDERVGRCQARGRNKSRAQQN